jgi:hypothetical protein
VNETIERSEKGKQSPTTESDQMFSTSWIMAIAVMGFVSDAILKRLSDVTGLHIPNLESHNCNIPEALIEMKEETTNEHC